MHTVANKKLNVAADKDVDADKRWDIVANKILNIVVDKAVDAKKRQDAAASKQPNATAKPWMLIKEQIIRGWE